MLFGIHIPANILIPAFVCMYVCMYVYMYMCMDVCIYKCMYMYVCVCVRTYVRAYVCIRCIQVCMFAWSSVQTLHALSRVKSITLTDPVDAQARALPPCPQHQEVILHRCLYLQVTPYHSTGSPHATHVHSTAKHSRMRSRELQRRWHPEGLLYRKDPTHQFRSSLIFEGWTQILPVDTNFAFNKVVLPRGWLQTKTWY